MAGNEKSGNGIAFRLSDDALEKKIDAFREEYGSGAKGMVTWPLFCSFLGYSVEQVRECYLRGKSGKNAYNRRAELLELFRTECRGMTYRTSSKQQALAKAEVQTDYLAAEDGKGGPPEIRILFGGGDDRWIEAVR